MSARTAADGVVAGEWVEVDGEEKLLGMSEFGCAAGCGHRGCKGVAGNGWGEEAAGDERAWLRRRLRTAWVKGVGGNEGTKKALGMSELGCADGCGCRGCKGVPENGWGDEGAGNKRAWLRGRGRRVCKGVAGNGWGEEGAVDEAGEKKTLGDERAWLRGRLRMAWVQGSGWKWMGRRSCWG